MFQHRTATEQRLHRVRRELIRPRIWWPRIPFDVTAWAVPANDDGTAADPVPVNKAIEAEFLPISPGAAWGAPWATTWFKLTATVPEGFDGQPVDAVLNVGFTNIGPGFQAEGMIWTENAEGDWVPERGLHPMNHVVRVSDAAVAGDVIEFLIEAASNPTLTTFRPEANSDLGTAGRDPIYTLGNCDLAIANRDLYELNQDYRCVWRWMVELPADEPRHNELLAAISSSLDALDPLDPIGTAVAARAQLASVMAKPASPSAHRISAIGHAHIDSAWLWPIRETVRKCARTFSNALRLMDADPEFRFGCSQAVQYEWMRVHYPSIFEGITEAVKRGQWVPIGGQWVEADGNITGGESHIRQLLHGQRFFREHFGVTCTEVWIPDVFGYPASLPQFFRLGGAERFLTQKLSWNRTNKFPHHTFWWEGIDGSRVYTHFPPVDTYNANFSPRELNYAVHNFRDHDVATRSLMPFGHGDGGGGPSPDMLDQFHRSRNFEGGPRIEIESPSEFFDAAMAENPNAPVWVGELYFETHRGTYTSQSRTKVGNRRAEVALREAELWSALAFGTSPQDGYPSAELDELWKTVLLHQFHDILPGTSIAWVHREAEATYADVLARLEVLIDRALSHLLGQSAGAAGNPLWLANPAPFDRDEIVVLDASKDLEESAIGASGQVLSDGHVALRVQAPAMSVASLPDPAVRADPLEPAAATTHGPEQAVRLNNGIISVEFNESGAVTSLVHLSTKREVIPRGETANEWHLHHDLPYEYDAWDIEEYYRNRVEVLTRADSVTVLDAGPLVARVQVTRGFRSSTLTEVVELRAGSPRLDVHVTLDWNERDHLLKVAWPLDIS
ncbi:MAG: alpha-mannosidase, partial [Microthrixaceae bacterium]|nr:alpha-mannosidase [Microthrixaceae bacterium]